MDRFEIKFDVSNTNLHNLIKSLSLVPIFQERKVKNIYYDTDELIFFNDSEEGTIPRKKIRIRHYNKNINKNLEIKFTHNFIRKKDVYLNIEDKNIRKFLHRSNVFEKVKPVLKLSYNRKYFMCRLGRVTYDYNLKFSKINQSYSSKDNTIKNILEFKTTDSNNREKFLRFSNLKNIRFSKYCYALNYLN